MTTLETPEEIDATLRRRAGALQAFHDAEDALRAEQTVLQPIFDLDRQMRPMVDAAYTRMREANRRIIEAQSEVMQTYGVRGGYSDYERRW